MNEQQRQGIRQILEHELRPAMGCTEPIAVAYTAALARTLLGRMPEHMQVDCSGNIVKNVKGVTVPNSGGRKGIDTAAVMGVISGRSDLELEVLNVVTPQDMEEVERLKAQGFCECRLIEGVPNLYVQVTVTGGGESAVVAIQDAHTNIVKKVKNGQVLFEKEQLQAGDLYTMEKEYLNIHDILEFGETEPVEDLRSLLEEQCRDNWNVAMEGLSKPYGAGVGYTLMANRKEGDLRTYCKAAAAAGSDARMNGCALPVVINSGSGNQGITVSVPVMVYARETGCGEEKMYRALAISNLLAIHQKKYIGKLSAYCGAVSAASAAGAAGKSAAPASSRAAEAAGPLEAVEAASAGPAARAPRPSRGRRRGPPPAPPVPAPAGAVPEQDGTEHVGGIGHAVVPLAVGGIAHAVQHAGNHQENHQQDHHRAQHLSGAAAAVDLVPTVVQIAQAVVVQVELVDPVKEVQHPHAKVSGHGVLIEVAVQIGGHLAIRHGVVRPHRQIAVPVFRVHHQDAVGGGQLDLNPQIVGVVADVLRQGGHRGHGDEAVVPLHPVGVVQGDLVLLGVREHIRTVADPVQVGAGGQRGVQIRRGGRHSLRLSAPPPADSNGGGDHQHREQDGHPCFSKNFHGVSISQV